jgi:hypothetical protein
MFRKELLILGALAIIVFLVVASGTSLAVRAVQRDGYMLAEDTFPGLVAAGEAIDRMNENWFNIHLLLSVESPEAVENLIQKIGANSTEPVWRRYRESIFDQEDARLFDEMQASRRKFLEVRSRYFDLVRAGNAPAAKALFTADLSSAFDRYRRAAVNIFELNGRIGRTRADRLIQLSRWTPYALAGFCVMVLLVGVLVGFKATLGAFSGSWSDDV